jgi:hypothetical protein
MIKKKKAKFRVSEGPCDPKRLKQPPPRHPRARGTISAGRTH